MLTVTWPEFFDNAPSPSPDGTSIATDILHWDPTNTFLDGSLSPSRRRPVGRSTA